MSVCGYELLACLCAGMVCWVQMKMVMEEVEKELQGGHEMAQECHVSLAAGGAPAPGGRGARQDWRRTSESFPEGSAGSEGLDGLAGVVLRASEVLQSAAGAGRGAAHGGQGGVQLQARGVVSRSMSATPHGARRRVGARLRQGRLQEGERSTTERGRAALLRPATCLGSGAFQRGQVAA